jgi:hypothetical protein
MIFAIYLRSIVILHTTNHTTWKSTSLRKHRGPVSLLPTPGNWRPENRGSLSAKMSEAAET